MATRSRVVEDRFVLEAVEPRRGGTAEVYAARDHVTGDRVALKLFTGGSITDDLLAEFFNRESQALTALEHPNIVRLVAAGKDVSTNTHYVALEWIEHRLQDYLADTPLGWDDFCDGVLEPILDALAYAHGRRILHRDIKPSNILVDAPGQPRLADFGIAKLLDSLREGRTVSDFATRMFAPPERDRGFFDVRGDLYSLGMTVLACLAPDHRIGEHGLDRVMYEAGIADAAVPFIRKLVAPSPDDRYFNASVALSEVRAIQRKRPQPSAKRVRIHLKVTGRARQDLGPRLRVEPMATGEGVISSDLSSDIAIGKFKTLASDPLAPDHLVLSGQKLSYRLVVDTNQPGSLTILSVAELPPSLLEAQRDRGMPLAADFIFDKPQQPAAAAEVLHQLQEAVERHDYELQVARDEAEDRRLFELWREILDVKERVEHALEAPIRFNRRKRLTASEFLFDIVDTPPDEVLGQSRRIIAQDGYVLAGTVMELRPRQVVWLLERGDTSRLPMRGELLLDRQASLQAIERQRRALDAVRWGRALRPDLGRLLVTPQAARPAEAVTSPLQPASGLDEAKRRAVEVALGSPDFTIVDGPPGTGKTTFIVELVRQLRLSEPGRRLLLSAQTNVAVDHAIGRMREALPDAWILRLGSAEKVGEEAVDLRLDPMMARWRDEVSKAARAFLQRWAQAIGVDPKQVQALAEMEELRTGEAAVADLKAELSALEAGEFAVLDILTRPDSKESDPDEDAETSPWRNLIDIPIDASFEDILSAIVSARTARTANLEKAQNGMRRLQRQVATTAGVDSDMPTTELRTALESATQRTPQIEKYIALKSLQDEWLARFGTGREFKRALLSLVDVVAGTCVGIASERAIEETEFDLVIIDEASKAAPTEALVPMSRGKRWVLVGDQRQLPPFVDQALLEPSVLASSEVTADDLRRTVFDRLIETLPPDNRTSLDLQHRMLQPIGDVVSECFYDGKLRSTRLVTHLRSISAALEGCPVVWYSTSRLANRREVAVPPSYHNVEEATRIREWLTMLNLRARQAGEKLYVAVISGYLAQKGVLDHQLRGSRENWSHLQVDVNTVDAFQGQERDLLVYSVTRSNQRRELGFLRSRERLNVALSRGRDGLVIFGDSDHCEAAPAEDNPFRRVLTHIRTHTQCRLEFLA